MKYRNNPGNLRYSVKNNWIGQIDPSNGFCQFSSMDAGLRALCITIDSYRIHHHLLSIRELITRYAPPTENDTAEYIRFVASAVGISEDASPFNSDSYFLRFVGAICLIETGYRLTSDDETTVFYRFRRCLANRPLVSSALRNSSLSDEDAEKLRSIQSTLSR